MNPPNEVKKEEREARLDAMEIALLKSKLKWIRKGVVELIEKVALRKQ